MSLDFGFVAIYSSEIFAGIVSFIGFKKYRQFTLPLRILEWYTIISLIEYCVIDIMVYKKIHTYLIWQCFAVFELFMFSCIFYLWRTSKRNGLFIWGGFATYLLIWVIGKFSYEPITGWDNYSEPISQLVQIGFGSWLLLGIMKETNIEWKRDVRFWVLSGIVLYAVGTFFFFGFFTPLLFSDRKMLRAIWPLNNALMIIQYIFFLRAFFCKSSPTSKNLLSHGTMNS